MACLSASISFCLAAILAVFSLMSPRVNPCCMPFTGIVVILQVEYAQLALHHVEICLVLFEFVAEFFESLAPFFLVASCGLVGLRAVSRSILGILGGWRFLADR